MKTKRVAFCLSLMIISISIIITSCNDKNDDDNNTPTNYLPSISITTPSTGDSISLGTVVNILIDANDPDGSITEVRFYIDNVGIAASNIFPYKYDWDTKNVSIGNHSIRVVANDNEGGEKDAECTVIIYKSLLLITDSRDNNTYKTVKIGGQIWMAENLAYLPSVSGSSNSSSTSPYYFVYGYEGTDVATAKATTNYQTYGVLYNWSAVMDGASSSNSNPSGVQGVCPTGWHVPSDAEWKELEMYVGMSKSEADKMEWRGTNEGGKLKEIGTSHWGSPNTGATNSSSFTALPGGYRFNTLDFRNVGTNAIFWSATEANSYEAWNRIVASSNSQVHRDDSKKENGFSIRCLKD